MLTVQHDNVKMHNPNVNLTGGMVMSNPLQFAMYTFGALGGAPDTTMITVIDFTFPPLCFIFRRACWSVPYTPKE